MPWVSTEYEGSSFGPGWPQCIVRICEFNWKSHSYLEEGKGEADIGVD